MTDTTELYSAPHVPIEDYFNRAGNGGGLADLPDRYASPLLGAKYSNVDRTVWADISTYQRVANSAYKEPMLSFRGDSGYGTDNNASANHKFCSGDSIQVELVYVVLVPGAEQSILSRMKNRFGSQPDPEKFAAMIDMESGSGFAGHGDHSVSGNKMADLLADWLDSQKRVVAYANHYDYVSNWPHMHSWLRPRMITASYGPSWPGTWGQQYHGGTNYPLPQGLPGSMAPFGSNVDLNYARRSLVQIKIDLGLTKPTPSPTPTPAPAYPTGLALEKKEEFL